MGREAPAPVLVPLGPWRYLVPTVGWREPLFAAYCLYSLEDVGSLLRGMSLKIKRKKKSAATMLELTGMG